MFSSRIPVLTKKTQLSTNNEEIKASDNKINSRPAVTNKRKEKLTMLRPRPPAPVKKINHSSIFATIKVKEKKIYPKCAVTNSQVSCVKKFPTQTVNRNQIKYQKPGSSQIAEERKRCSVAVSKQSKIVIKKADSEQGKKADSKEDCCQEKENFSESKENDANFNEDYRKFILSGKELTPSMLNWGPDGKFSLTRHSSLIHRPFVVSADPCKDALKAIENWKLLNPEPSQAKRSDSSTPMKINRTPSLLHRPFVVSADPCKEALKAIENWKLSNPGPSQVKRSTFSTPMQESFIYSRNPCEKDLKSTDILKQKKGQMKSQKKVTFNLQADYVPLHSAQQQRKELQLQESEARLARISEIDESSRQSSRESSLKGATLTEELANSKTAPSSVHMSSKWGSKNTIFTSYPVSCKPQLLENSGSPVLLGNKPKKIITHDVPNKNGTEVLSPIRLKLNFNDVVVKSKEDKRLSDMQSSIISDTNNGILLRDISTARNFLDRLGDDECSVILLRQKFPIVCGSSMKNPMLIIFSETDETKDALQNEASSSKVIKVPVIKVKEDDLKHLISSGYSANII